MQPPATPDRSLVTGAGKRFESASRLSPFPANVHFWEIRRWQNWVPVSRASAVEISGNFVHPVGSVSRSLYIHANSDQESSTRGRVGRCAGDKERPVLELWKANLSGADLQDANLWQAYLQATTLNGADLTSLPILSARSVWHRGPGILRIVAKVLVGVTGGIAAYKAPGVIRRLKEVGHEVEAA